MCERCHQHLNLLALVVTNGADPALLGKAHEAIARGEHQHFLQITDPNMREKMRQLIQKDAR